MVKAQNAELLDELNIKVKGRKEKLLKIPLYAVEKAYRFLSEIVNPYRSTDEIVLVPMGPKPHVLAALLVAMKFQEIACLRVSAERAHVEKVEAKGDIIVTRVVMIENQENNVCSVDS